MIMNSNSNVNSHVVCTTIEMIQARSIQGNKWDKVSHPRQDFRRKIEFG